MARPSLHAWCWPWLSSGAAWFLFFNVLVGAVAVLSWRQGGDAEMCRRRRLTRSASSMVMERLRSMSVFAAFHSVPEHDYGSGLTPPASLSQLHHVQEQEYCMSSQGDRGEEVGHEVKQPEPAQPAGERLTAVTVAPSTPSTPEAAAAAAAEVRSVDWMSGSDKAEAETRTEMSRCLGDACAVVARQRHAPAPEPTPATAAAKGAMMERPRKQEPAVKVAETVGRRAYAEVEEKAEVNARAERFIRHFREDLKLERIKSILNHGRAAAAKGAMMERPRKQEPAVKVAETVGRRAYAEVEEKAEVNARAERFIRQFREDLKLERIKSILNHGRAAAAASAR